MSAEQNADDPANMDPDMEGIDRQLRAAGLSFPHVTPVEMRFVKIVEQVREMDLPFPKLDLKKAPKLVGKLIRSGQLEWELNGRNLNWVMGLSAFCRHDGENVIAEITEAYGNACIELHGVAMDDVEAFDDAMLYDEDLDPYEAKLRGAYLAPDLPIVDRQYLTPKFIGEVLRPYLAAKVALLRSLTQQIETAHKASQFLIFKRVADGAYRLVIPGAGFDEQGSYHVPRSSYLSGFNCPDEEVDRSLLRNSSASFDPEALAFLTADQIPEYCTKISKPSRGGRKKGTSLAHLDAPLIERMRSMVLADETGNVSRAAELVHDEDPSRVAGGGAPESKIKRLARGYTKAFPPEY